MVAFSVLQCDSLCTMSHDRMNCTVAVWPRWLSHGALHSAGYYNGWKTDNEHSSGDAFSVSISFWISSVVWINFIYVFYCCHT
jgi:hypothetical protein